MASGRGVSDGGRSRAFIKVWSYFCSGAGTVALIETRGRVGFGL